MGPPEVQEQLPEQGGFSLYSGFAALRGFLEREKAAFLVLKGKHVKSN